MKDFNIHKGVAKGDLAAQIAQPEASAWQITASR
jgi:hypothetical protein